MKKLRGVGIGAGYFSDFQYEAWSRIENVEIVAISDLKLDLAINMGKKYGIKASYTNYMKMLEIEKPDFVDVITPAASHFEIIKAVLELGIPIICQKPLAPTHEEALKIMELVIQSKVPFMVHENFRFQPWHREIKNIISSGVIGELSHLQFFTRTGDGWPDDAYLARQPYFRDYKRLLIYETGVHFIDLMRFYTGEIIEIYAKTRRLNKNIKGEDAAQISATSKSGVWLSWDANRYNESLSSNPRYTFCTILAEGSKGSIRLDYNGKITIQSLGEAVIDHHYIHNDIGFGGDCCFFTQLHFIDCLINNKSFETNINDYIKNLILQEKVYQSANERKNICF